MRWFMSYLQSYGDSSRSFGHVTYEGDEHPIARARRWTETHGQKEGFVVVVLSFQVVTADCPANDECLSQLQ